MTQGKRKRSVRRKRVEKNGQMLVQFPLTWGGKRPGAGRKPVGEKAKASHHRRPEVPKAAKGALHVTLKVIEGLPSLRKGRCMKAIWGALAKGKERFGMRVVHFCVQKNHLHLIVEVSGRKALFSGMQGLCIRLARRLNGALGRKGKLFADRYQAESLDSFARIRRALAYVLNNQRRHAYQHGGWVKRSDYIDPCTSGWFFDGWRGRKVKPPEGLDPPVVAAREFPLAKGWRRYGLIEVDEIPGKAKLASR
jgi:REP element-mobilizing transposase RayT